MGNTNIYTNIYTVYTYAHIQKEKSTKTGSQLNNINSIVFQTNAITTLSETGETGRGKKKEGRRKEGINPCN